MAMPIHEGVVAANLTRYLQVGGHQLSPPRNTEVETQYRSTRTGTIQAGEIQVGLNTLQGSTDVRIRINGANVLTVTIPALTTGRIQIPGTAAITKGDLVSVEVQTVGGGEEEIRLAVSYELV